MNLFIFTVDVEHQGKNNRFLCFLISFVAPEVINITDMSTRYDVVCDVYSLGLVFHILLTGKPAFPGRSYNTIV
jgi:serine/threonine protein kinase